ncbi:transcriptional regulator [Pluralibacter gergoviae]|uniref:helix-turn-helix domain-containing protein n=1 Tax=Pluralibacter gergoviae TaxID=61647 RepID=UPI0005EC9096|nr:helix-turn-helix domain-containing protein [Pluralibacter gergoviae]KJM64948.1 XRE family transcriptional regulator [Pluralibacter gergoviae]MDU4004287.1 helix-turn-helix domain-containing protein [Pluralibacter gergoviae]OUQ99863.1 transcriptional regulator [Pluralibacter gergoviae]
MKITSPAQLAIYLKDRRKQQKQAQSAVAERVGLRQDTVSKFENSPDKSQIDTLFKILSSLNMELHLEPREAKKSEQGWKEEW